MLRFLPVLKTSVLMFALYLLLWQAYIWTTSPGKAHGVGYYQAWAPVFFMTGALFMVFGVFLIARR